MNNSFFVLDFGTRFVRGLICERVQATPGNTTIDKCGIRITDCEIREHKSRAMLAGQIHDIEKVSDIVREILAALENRLTQRNNGQRVKLSKVAVAVAGRNLLTRRGSAGLSRTGMQPVTAEEVKQAELLAVQNALENISTEAEYYCVGYSGAGYRIDGEEITNLVGHRGFSIGADVLVTLLPRQVLEAMFEVAGRTGLEIDYLTLEPIAALEASITESMKPLSIVLIDIGAGTSDIAVVSKGMIRSYGMVPVAGDMLTEVVCSDFIVDFNTGEWLKREAGWAFNDRERHIEFNDIFNRHHSLPAREVLDKLKPAVFDMAKRLADEIKKISGDNFSEYAVVLVGGGSMTPFLENEMASAMNVQQNRIGARPVNLNDKIEDTTGKFSGPDAATAAGIGLMSARKAGLSLTHLIVNDSRVTVVSSEKNPSVLSVLLSNGINIKQIYGRPGLAKTFMLNGEFKSVKGEPPVPATIELNGEKASLDTPVRESDKILFYPAVSGKDANASIADALPLPLFKLNGETVKFPAEVSVNGQQVSSEALIEDRADIHYTAITGLRGVLAAMNLNNTAQQPREISLDVDGEYVTLKSDRQELKLNGRPADLNADLALNENDEVEFRLLEPEWKLSDVVSMPQHGADLKIKINGEEFIFPGGKGKILRNGKEAGLEALIGDGDIIRSVSGKNAEAVLVDVFKFVSLDPNNQIGKKIRLLIDGRESQYTSPLHDNADVNVYFE